jgi:adenosylcobinamide-GDP ribazoletransferase
MRGLRAAVSFLTRVPVGLSAPEGRAIAAAAPWFPIVGALIGAAVGGVYGGLRSVGLPSLAASTTALAFGALLTGGLHEDGLADTADALGAGNRDRALEIMADPHHGTFGVLAIVSTVIVRAVGLGALPVGLGVLAAIEANTLARVATLALMATSRPARCGGLGATYIVSLRWSSAILGILAGCLIVIVAMRSIGPATVMITASISFGVRAMALRRWGGITGDVLGAAEQSVEAGVYVVVAVGVST